MKIPDANGIVIDGFPRDVGQALSFDDQVSLKRMNLFSYFVHMMESTIIMTLNIERRSKLKLNENKCETVLFDYLNHHNLETCPTWRNHKPLA